MSTRYVLLCVVLLTSIAASASERKWEEAKVLRLTASENGVQVVVVPMGGGLYGASVPNRRAFFWLRGDKYTYVVPNYCKGVFVQWWLRVTIGGTAKISADNSKTLRVIDDDGKERKVSIVQRIANSEPVTN